MVEAHRSQPDTGSYRLASFEFTKSVISIEPGAWVMQNSGLTSAMTACGVTPQAQNTGNSSLVDGYRVAIIGFRQIGDADRLGQADVHGCAVNRWKS